MCLLGKRQSTLDCKKKTLTSLTCRERPLINGLQKARERGREYPVFYEKGGCEPDRCRKCRNYLFRQLCFLRRIGLLFATVLSHPFQSGFSYILCNILHLPLCMVAYEFIVSSCWRYPSQHRYDSCTLIEICV